MIIHNIIAFLEHKIEQFQQRVKMGKLCGWFGHHMKWKGKGTFDAYLVIKLQGYSKNKSAWWFPWDWSENGDLEQYNFSSLLG